jgi:transposase
LIVHGSQTHAAVLHMATGELRGVRLRMPPTAVVEFLPSLPGPVRAVHEAGRRASGWLARRSIAGSTFASSPRARCRASGDRVKTDRRDAERLAQLLAPGELRFAFVPSIADEQFCDVIRAIEDRRGDLLRGSHRLSKFLVRRGLRWTGRGSAWTSRPVEMLLGPRAALLALEQAIPDSSHAATIARLRCFRGIDTLPAAGLCAEVGELAALSAQVAVGVFGERADRAHRRSQAPSGVDHQGRLGHARRLLGEAAHHYRHRPAVGDRLARRQHGQDPRVMRSPGGRNTGGISTGRCSRPTPQARRRRRDRLRLRAPRVLMGGRPERLIPTPATTAARCCWRADPDAPHCARVSQRGWLATLIDLAGAQRGSSRSPGAAADELGVHGVYEKPQEVNAILAEVGARVAATQVVLRAVRGNIRVGRPLVAPRWASATMPRTVRHHHGGARH